MRQYLHWIVENFGNLEPTMDLRDGRRWALNHARLVLNRDVAKANGYFESFTPPGGDNDIYLIRFLRTLLDFRDSPRLSDEAEARIVGYIKNWPRNTRTADRDHSLTARKVAYLTDGRYDGFLPTVWLALGMGEPRFDFTTARVPGLEPATIHIASGNEPRLKQDEGMFFACSRFVPHPVVQALAEEARTRKALVYQGRRFLGWPGDELWKTQKWMPGAIYYYNTPHVSMGSVHSDGWIHQCRYNSVLFGADPSQALAGGNDRARRPAAQTPSRSPRTSRAARELVAGSGNTV